MAAPGYQSCVFIRARTALHKRAELRGREFHLRSNEVLERIVRLLLTVTEARPDRAELTVNNQPIYFVVSLVLFKSLLQESS